MQTAIIGGFAWFYLSASLDDQIGERALKVAQTIAATPGVIRGVEQRDSATLNQLSKTFASTNDALFIVIGDHNAIRLAHPNPDRLGFSMADDDGDDGSIALVDGQAYVDKAEGSLGLSMRGKAPIFDASGDRIIGIVSVGYSLNQVRSVIARYNSVLLAGMLLMLLVSVLLAIFVASRFKRAIFGLEPEQIARLFVERDATLQSVREGIIAINREGLVTTVNRTAVTTLGLNPNEPLIGQPIRTILSETGMLDALEKGEPEFDQEVWLKGRQMIVNRLPVWQGDEVIGLVSSFRLRDELDQVSQKLTQIQQYADTLRSQTHEYSNKLHTIAGLIQIGASDEALALIGNEVTDHQALIGLLMNSVPDPILAGCIVGKYNRAREMGLSLMVDPDSRMADLPSDMPKDQLVSVLGNLLENALEATLRHAGTRGVVELSMMDLGLDLIFEVTDQGPGIDERDQERIFERGYTSNAGNRGIGLYLIKRFVDQWGGSITVENRPTGGSRFTVYINKIAASVGVRD
ncbi:MAG: ATP-binding protein [Saccharospirillum sp.]